MNLSVLLLAGFTHSAFLAIFGGNVNGEECSCHRESGINVGGVKVHCYNNEYNIHDVYNINDAALQIFSNSFFDIEQCIDVYVPDYNTPINDSFIATARCVFSQIICDKKATLTIIIDHLEYTTAGNDQVKDYRNAVSYVKSIGEIIGRLLLSLVYIIDKEKITIIGHGLGAQIVGYAAQFVKDNKVVLPIIYAVDPAGPCFTNCPEEHVRRGQAERVVTIHCSDTEGTTLNVANYDVYANDGKTQPGCSELDYNCNHKTCVSIALLPAVKNKIWRAKRCPSYKHFVAKRCEGSDTLLVGYRKLNKPYPDIRNGKFYFSTNGDVVVTCLNLDSFISNIV